MKMWMANPERDQLLLVAGAMAATSVFTACENEQQSVGVVLEALKAGYQTGVFTADDKFGDAFLRSLKPYDCVVFTDLIPFRKEMLRK